MGKTESKKNDEVRHAGANIIFAAKEKYMIFMYDLNESLQIVRNM